MNNSPNTYIKVPEILSESQIKSYIEEGFLIVPALVAPDEIGELKRDTIKIARGHYPHKAIKPLSEKMTDDEVLHNFLCIHMPHYVSPVIEKYLKHPQLCGVLSQITAAHIPFWDGSVKFMQSMLFVKPPGFQGQAWHQDELYIPTRDRSLIGAWIAMDDATIENGCLWVIPGSHRTGYLYPQKPHSNLEEYDYAEESFGFDDTQEIPVEVKAGSVVFFNGYLLHRSRKNRSTIYRRVLVNHYCNAWSLLPWSIQKGEPPAKADYRCIVPVTGTDPYAWKGYQKLGDVYIRPCKASEEKANS